MKLTAFPAMLALAAVSICVPAFAKTPAAPRDQASTAHQDTKFLEAANQGSVDEVELGQLALKKSENQDVKDFAQKMVDDHTKLLNDMKPFDQEAGIEIPSHASISTDALKVKLDLLSGKSFDKAYIKAMVEDHHMDLKDFMAEEQATGYPAFKAAVGNGAEVVRGHLEMVNSLAKKNGVTPAPVPSGK